MSGPLVAVAAAGLAYSVYNGEQTKKANNEAQDQAKVTAEKQADQAQQATNAANKKAPNSSASLSAAQQAAASGNASTMLTGATGVDNSTLNLGKSTLLGS